MENTSTRLKKLIKKCQLKGHDACSGDGGAPLVTRDPGDSKTVMYLYGLNSFGPQQCGIIPSVYTKVDYFIDWIRANMRP